MRTKERGGTFGWGTTLLVGRSWIRFPLMSLKFFIYIIWRLVGLSLQEKLVPGIFSWGKDGRSVGLTTFMWRLSRNLGVLSSWADTGTKSNISAAKEESVPGRPHRRTAPVLTELCRLQHHGGQAIYSSINISPNCLPFAQPRELYCTYWTTQFHNCI